MRRFTQPRRPAATTCTTTTCRRRRAARRGGRRGPRTASASRSRWTARSVAIEVGGNVGAAEVVFSAREYLSSPEYSPDGRWLAYTADDDGKSINLRVRQPGHRCLDQPHHRHAGERRAGVVARRQAPGLRLHRAQRLLQRLRDARSTDGKAGRRHPGHDRSTTSAASGSTSAPIDVHISPAWSPDGKELLLVSNREIPLGSGGIWRVPVDANVMGSRGGEADPQGGDALSHAARSGRLTASDWSTRRTSAASTPSSSSCRPPAVSPTS